MPSPAKPAPGASLSDLVDVMERLLAPDGCPWDREQTLESLRPYLLEETYEVLEAMEANDPAEHCEELGDLLMQVVFQAALRQREGAFAIDDVVSSICEKLTRRHPHVFGDKSGVETPDQVLAQWADIKDQEKAKQGKKRRILDGIPVALPALARAQKVSERAARVGFDWPDVAGCRVKVVEELEELDRAASGGDPGHVEAELGDLLFAAVSLARKLEVDAESALRAATDKFARRFTEVEDTLEARGSSTKQATLEEMDELWNQIKKRT